MDITHVDFYLGLRKASTSDQNYNYIFISLTLLTTVKDVFLSFIQHTALHNAARDGRDYTAECLVKKGANVNVENKDEFRSAVSNLSSLL